MKREFTVGEIARIINVARSTVIQWIRDDKLEAFQLPGGNNRVPRESLVSFMKKYNIPLDFLDQTTKKRVLLVDDDTDLLASVEKVFAEDEDIIIKTAATGFQTGMLASEFRPHVVVLDISIGDIDGRDVCLTLRDTPELKKTKIIAISGVLTREEEKELTSQGFDKFLKKPFSGSELRDFLRKLLRL